MLSDSLGLSHDDTRGMRSPVALAPLTPRGEIPAIALKSLDFQRRNLVVHSSSVPMQSPITGSTSPMVHTSMSTASTQATNMIANGHTGPPAQCLRVDDSASSTFSM